MCTPYYAPAYAFGGSVTVEETIVEGLLAEGHEVTVATTDVLDERRRLALTAPAQPPGARLVRFRNLSHRLAATNLYLPRGLRRWLLENVSSFDVVLLQDLYSMVSVASARAARSAGVPYVLQPHGTLSPARERGRSAIKHAFLALWGRRTVREASALLHTTAVEREEMLAAGAPADRLLRLPPPLRLPSVEGSQVQDPPVPTVVYVGRLHAIKRVDLLIEAVALARAEVSDLTLEIIGPGDRLARRLGALAARLGVAEAVHLHGYVSEEEKVRMLAQAHVFALLSSGEGLPMAALEAMACGTPVVLSAGCHMPEVDGRAGIVVDGRAEEVAAAIAVLLSDSARRLRLGDGARAFAHEFRHDVVMPRVAAALAEVVHAAAPLGLAQTAR
jgi:glycosyltransferase involved in cell wall biosynthesis